MIHTGSHTHTYHKPIKIKLLTCRTVHRLTANHTPRSHSISNRRSPTLIKKPSYSQFPVPPGAPPWRDSPPQPQLSRSRTMQEKKGKGENGRISPYTLSVAAEFSLKRANRQLLAMGETLESAKSELSSPTSLVLHRLPSELIHGQVVSL